MFSRKLKMKFKFYVCNCISVQYGFMIDLLWWDPAVFSVGHFWPFLLTVAECFVTPHYQLALGGRDKPPNTQAVFVSNPGACCNIGYPSELKTRGILFACKLLLSCQIILKFCTEHGIFKMIWRVKLMFWTNEVSWDLSLGWVWTDILYCNWPLDPFSGQWCQLGLQTLASEWPWCSMGTTDVHFVVYI